MKFDEDAIACAVRKAAAPALREMAADMERVLKNLSSEQQGRPLDEVKPALQGEFARHGWTITEPELTAYAEAIASGQRIRVQSEL
ncbi:MAG: hypothetical protein M3198_15520 [Actinomycetota bacterium]|nr:hypothetical protein [Actinomycetota bacterium]